MSRFTDPLLFFALTVISAIVWWILAAKQAIPATEGALAPMTVAVAIVIATPALALVAVLALVRSLVNANPRPFWAWVTAAGTLGAVLSWVAGLVTAAQNVEVGFGTSVWLLGTVAVAGLIALILALTGAIPTATPVDEDDVQTPDKKKAPKERAPKEKRGVEFGKRSKEKSAKDTPPEASVPEAEPAPISPAEPESEWTVEGTQTATDTISDADPDLSWLTGDSSARTAGTDSDPQTAE